MSRAPARPYLVNPVQRLTSLLLLFAYLLSSPGLVYSMHFCGQQVTNVSFAHRGDDDCCCRTATRSACYCCHDQEISSAVQDVKLTAFQAKMEAPAWQEAPTLLPIVWQLSTVFALTKSAVRWSEVDGAPPPACPAYVRGHAFRI